MRMKQKFSKTASIKFIKAVSSAENLGISEAKKVKASLIKRSFLKTLQVKAKQQKGVSPL